LIDSSIQEVKRMDSLWDVAVDEGIGKGEKKLAQLIQILLNAEKQEEVMKVISDESTRKEYYQKYNIFD